MGREGFGGGGGGVGAGRPSRSGRRGHALAHPSPIRFSPLSRRHYVGTSEADVTPPPVGMTALTWGLFMGVSSNVRYQVRQCLGIGHRQHTRVVRGAHDLVAALRSAPHPHTPFNLPFWLPDRVRAGARGRRHGREGFPRRRLRRHLGLSLCQQCHWRGELYRHGALDGHSVMGGRCKVTGTGAGGRALARAGGCRAQAGGRVAQAGGATPCGDTPDGPDPPCPD